MALLDMCVKHYFHVEVAHVNYHKRKTALRDEMILRDYCEKHNIKFNRLDVYPEDVKGNFQAYARKARYVFFANICNRDNLDYVLVAHQQDDLIETYLMQKNKNIGVSEYGLAEENIIYGAKVIRPLLDKTKIDLQDYCDNNHISYGIDESNLLNDYARNKIRHDCVEKLSSDEREEILNEIKVKNIEYLKMLNKVNKFLYDSNKYEYNEFINFPYLKLLIRNIFNVTMSDKYLDDIIKTIKHKKKFSIYKNNIYLVCEYGYVSFFEKPNNYSYKINKDETLVKEYFEVHKVGNDRFSCVTVSDEDYPLTIRNFKEGDEILMKYGTKKINRFFIDKKIGLYERLTWPIVFNKNKTAILVPGLGCDVKHYSKNANLYVIKLN